MTKDQVRSTEEALKLALEALEFNQANWQGKDRAITAIKEALAAPVQEHAEQLVKLGWQYFECPACGSEGARAFPKPAAQRQWVGLTQQDIDVAFDDTQEGGGFDEFARAIEQRLKEKNT